MTLALQASGITKRFPGVLANDHVDFALEKGEIHALAGRKRRRQIHPDEHPLRAVSARRGDNQRSTDSRRKFTSPHDAIAQGIGMVHQHFMLVPPLTVTENIMLGQESLVGCDESAWQPGGARPAHVLPTRIRELSEQYGLDVDPDAYVRDLTVGAQQRVEIVKALYRSAEILILDEPTAVLTPQEADELFVIMRGMVEQGKSIVFITHKLREVFAVADRISVMRAGPDGRHGQAGRGHRRDAGRNDGGPRSHPADRQGRGASRRTPVLQVKDLRVLDDRQHMAVDGVSLEVRAGEILGVAGVQGNGQTELAEALTGLRQVGRRASDHPGSGYDPCDAPPGCAGRDCARARRPAESTAWCCRFPVRDNLVLCTYYQPALFQRRRDGLPGDRAASRGVGADVRHPHAQHR